MSTASATAILTVVTALASAVSAIASAVSAYKSHHSITTQRHITATISVGATAAALADSLGDPDILLLHGIAEVDLQRDHIKPSELSYLVKSFTMGETYYRVHGADKSHIQISKYRRSLLTNPTVRIAWTKYIKGKFISSVPYTEAIDEYLEKVSPSNLAAVHS